MGEAEGLSGAKITTIDRNPKLFPFDRFTQGEALILISVFFHSGLCLSKVLMKDLLTRSTLWKRDASLAEL